MPVEFAQASRFQRDNGGRNVGGWKIAAVDYFYAAARRRFGLLHPAGKKGVTVGDGPRTRIDLSLFFFQRARKVAREDEQFPLRNLAEGGLRNIEVLRHH